MINLFKKPEQKNIKVYQLDIYWDDQGRIPIIRKAPKVLSKYYLNAPNLTVNAELFVVKYLRLKPNHFKDLELDIHFKGDSGLNLDIESSTLNLWVTSERFKEFAEKEDLQLEFFPVLVDKERRYLTSWRSLPVLTDYEVDVEKTKMSEYGQIVHKDNTCFRNDVINYLNYNLFGDPFYLYKFITNTVKEKLDAGNFLLTFKEMDCSYKNTDKKEVENHLKLAREIERKTYLDDEEKNKLQATDDYLEKILLEENNHQALEKFRSEMKGEWKKDFERYEQGLMEPLERITYW